jgi:ATP-binding cassette, subfamily B, bacterial
MSALGDRFPALARLGLLRERAIPYVAQLSETECGPACLAMVLGYHGKEVSLEEVRDVCRVGRDGVDAFRLVEGANQLGLRGRGLKVPLEELSELPVGATILHWEFSHFVVLAGVDGRTGAIEVMDPALGRRTVSADEAGRAFTGVALTFEPRDTFAPVRRQGTIYGALRDLVLSSGVLPRLLTISLVLQVLGLALPVLTAQIVDRVLPRGDLDLLLVLLVGLGTMIAFETVGSVVRGYLLSNLRARLDTQMSLGFLDHLVSLPYSYFQLRSAGDLMMRLNSNSVLRETLTSTALSGILDGLLVVVYLAVLLVGSPPMAVAALAAGVVDVLVYLLFRRRLRELANRSLQAGSRAQGYEVEMLTAMETLKAMGCEHRAVGHWSNLFVDQLNVDLARDRVDIRTDAILGAVRAVGPIAVLATGTYQLVGGHLTLGTMLALAAVAGSFIEPLSKLVHTAMSLEVIRSTLDRVADVLTARPENDQPGLQAAGPLSGHVVLDRVSFSYAPEAPPVVREVSLEILPGQFVAIVGRSGAGKSTLANLILGLYRPASGRILFDGRDLAGLDVGSVRRQLGIVNQNVSLFAATVRENISLSDPSLGLDRVRAAARRACIDGDIMAMPLGYNTPLGDRGSALSGGQRQRLALARALVRRPAVLLLDEATSALDAQTEAQVGASLAALDCTRVVIAHRLSTVRAADVILVMEEGRLVEAGDHHTLLRNQGPYARLVAGQLVDGAAS